jgi:hypothetical protein
MPGTGDRVSGRRKLAADFSFEVDMINLTEKSVAELEVLAADLRGQVARDPQHCPSEQITLSDIEWELEKRRWRGK